MPVIGIFGESGAIQCDGNVGIVQQDVGGDVTYFLDPEVQQPDIDKIEAWIMEVLTVVPTGAISVVTEKDSMGIVLQNGTPMIRSNIMVENPHKIIFQRRT